MPLLSPVAGDDDSKAVLAPGFSNPIEPSIPGDLLTLNAENGRWR